MDIYRAERLAQDRSIDPKWDRSFKLIGPLGNVIACKWLDPHFGMFTLVEHEGFMMTKRVPDDFRAEMPDL